MFELPRRHLPSFPSLPTSAPQPHPHPALPSFWTRAAAAGGGGWGVFAEGRGRRFKKKKKTKKKKRKERDRGRGKGSGRKAVFADSGPAAGVREEWRRSPARYPGWCGRLPGRTTLARGFPWKVRAPGVASLLRRGLRVLGEVAIFAGWRRRQQGSSRGVPFAFESESRRPTQEVSGDPHSSVSAWVSPTSGPSVTGPGLRPFPAGLNSESISTPSQFQVLVDLNSFHYFQILST